MKRVAFILGTRPEIIKLYPVIKCFDEAKISFDIIHTNQHYSRELDSIFFEQLELPKPDYNLGIGSGSQAVQTGTMISKIGAILEDNSYNIVIVQGDTNTVLAGAIAAAKLQIPIAHVEAGLRSFDRSMPEETNRILTDHVSSLLFCPAQKQKDLLRNDGIKSGVHVVGNTIVDAVDSASKLAATKSEILKTLKLKREDYFLLTCHRPSNTDSEENLAEVLDGLNTLALQQNKRCIFPMHPRLATRIEKYRKRYPTIELIEPTNYLDMLQLISNASMVFTDSGGLQEETCILRKKCVILRTNTERPETLEVGGAVLLKRISSVEIQKEYHLIKDRTVEWKNPFGDGKTALKIKDIVHESIA